MVRSSSSVAEIDLINRLPSVRMVADWMVNSVASLKINFNSRSFPGGILNKIAIKKWNVSAKL